MESKAMKIIILHGLYMHGLVMQPLSLRLKKIGLSNTNAHLQHSQY